MKHSTLFRIAILAGALSALAFVTVASAADCTPITGGTSYGGAALIGPDTEYCASIDTSQPSRYFYFNAAPGQRVTMVFTSTTTFNYARFFLYDQAHQFALYDYSLSGPEQSHEFVYMGNSTTPTRYYFVVMQPGSGANGYTFRYEVDAQLDGGSPGDAGDAIGTAKVITPGADTTYADNLLGFIDHDDWYKINAVSGQIITMTLAYPTYDGDPPSAPALRCIVYDQTGTWGLGDLSMYPPGDTQMVFQWMSNNTQPSAYYLRLYVNAYGGLAHYTLQFQLGQQVDANQPGDAGDNFDTARSVTLSDESPFLESTHNLLGGSDSVDYYMVKLPPVDPFEPPVRYRFWIAPVSWPAGSGSLSVTAYNDQRNQISGLGGTINAPSMTVLSNEITACGSSGCYFKVATTGYTGFYRLQYRVRFAPIRFIYLPLMIR